MGRGHQVRDRLDKEFPEELTHQSLGTGAELSSVDKLRGQVSDRGWVSLVTVPPCCLAQALQRTMAFVTRASTVLTAARTLPALALRTPQSLLWWTPGHS